MAAPDPETVFPLRPPVALPDGVSEPDLRRFLESVRVADADAEEMRTYCREDFWRFVRTYDLARPFTGRALELGANPYFTTMLLREFTGLELELANYFGRRSGLLRRRRITQEVSYRHREHDSEQRLRIVSREFNIERDRFPFRDGEFNLVFFCEIIEHLLEDPFAALSEVRRVLAPGGILILTTPNVNRLENVVAMTAGVNVYDPYSGYGPYGRHNREYNKHELHVLLSHLGFEIDCLESADVHENRSGRHMDWTPLIPLLQHRERDLGQYLFVRASSRKPARPKRPAFLFRSYPPDALDTSTPAAA